MYKYEELRPNIFTDEGQREFLKVRDFVRKTLEISGAITMDAAISTPNLTCGDTWERMAYVDRLVELGEISEVDHGKCAGQNRIFI